MREREVAEAAVLEAEAEARAEVEAIRASGRGVWFGCWVMPTWSNVIACGESRFWDLSWGDGDMGEAGRGQGDQERMGLLDLPEARGSGRGGEGNSRDAGEEGSHRSDGHRRKLGQERRVQAEKGQDEREE